MEKIIVMSCYASLFISLVSFSLIEKKSIPPETAKIQKKIFKNDFQSNKPSSSLSKEIIEPVIEHSATAKKLDTIPKNASKEFIAGYNAAMKYKNERSDVSVQKKKETEAALSKKETTTQTAIQKADIAITTTVKMTDAKEKKRIEEALVAEKKSN